MKKTFLWILSFIVAPLIVLAIAFFSGQWWEKRSEKYLYYEVTNTGNLLSPVAGQTELTYNKRRIDNIGSIRVKVYNEDAIELDNITFTIGITGKKPLHIHYMDYFDVDRKKKRVMSNYPIPPTDSVTSNEFSYTITPLNKSDKPVFELLINLEDVDNVTVDFTMQVKGVEPKLYEPKENKKYWEHPMYFFMSIFSVLYITFLYFFYYKK